jgi:signal transduction histidine kinase
VRRRLFWTIAGVAAITGLLVLVGSVISSQRAATEATYRELRNSSDEAISLIHDRVASSRPGAVRELIRLVEGGDLSPLFAQIRRVAGGSEIGVAVVGSAGQLLSGSDLFDRVPSSDIPADGATIPTRASTGELVVLAGTVVEILDEQVRVVVGIAREAPIVVLRDQFPGVILLVVGIGALAALMARLLSSQVTERLEPLAVASRKVAAGDMRARVPDLGDPELDQVASAFNEMASELEATRDREREFILGVGHDLRTPLTTIGGYAEALETGDLDPDELERVGAVLGMQSRQLSRLIDDLSMLARLEQPEFGLRAEQVDVGAHVSEVVEGFRRRATELGVALDIEVQQGLVTETDPDRLGQIAQNLVENALRHTPEAGRVTVVVGDGPTISVTDTGSGISPEDLPHVFERYFVGRQRSVRKEGSGLGLSIVKGLVDRMGGTVEATSTAGKGTTIEVRLDGVGSRPKPRTSSPRQDLPGS